jgi:hypothetical protein
MTKEAPMNQIPKVSIRAGFRAWMRVQANRWAVRLRIGNLIITWALENWSLVIFLPIPLKTSKNHEFGYANGEIAAQTNALGLIITYARDSLNGVIEAHARSLNVTNTYDKLDLATTGPGAI